MPIPFIGGLWTKRTTRVRLPAASGRALIDKILKLTIVCLWSAILIGKFIGGIFQQRDEFAAKIGVSQAESAEFVFAVKLVLSAVALSVVCALLRSANLSAVKIITAEAGMAELQFSRTEYAKELAEINQLRCHEEPFKKRYARNRN